MPNSTINASKINLINSVIHSTIETIQKINDSVEQRYPTPRNSLSETNNQESQPKNVDNRKHSALFSSVWKSLKTTTIKSDNFVSTSKKFENLKTYTKDFDECSSSGNFLVKHGILSFLEKNTNRDICSRTVSESSSCSDFMTSGDKLEQTERVSICRVDGVSR